MCCSSPEAWSQAGLLWEAAKQQGTAAVKPANPRPKLGAARLAPCRTMWRARLPTLMLLWLPAQRFGPTSGSEACRCTICRSTRREPSRWVLLKGWLPRLTCHKAGRMACCSASNSAQPTPVFIQKPALCVDRRALHMPWAHLTPGHSLLPPLLQPGCIQLFAESQRAVLRMLCSSGMTWRSTPTTRRRAFGPSCARRS